MLSGVQQGMSTTHQPLGQFATHGAQQVLFEWMND